MKCALLILSLLVSQLRAQSFGWRSNPTHSKGLKQFIHVADTPLPVSVDLRTSGHLPPVYDQGQIGSCTANAILAAFEFAWHKQHKAFMNGSRLGLYYDERVHDGDPRTDGGSTTASGVFVLSGGGVGTEKTWPYVTSKFAIKPISAYYKEAHSFVAVTTYDVDSTDGVSIRKALALGYPVAFGGYVYSDIQTLKKPFVLRAPHGRPIGGHEMLIVGYSDTSKLYTIRNSWGVSYGDAGYLYARYTDIHNPKIYEDFAVVSLTK